ncbi:MAG: serine--tRNA ligase [candidate division WWE3 bacterium]|nr:serine--tRNA ligase [candidate division WWE3 bacterium]
MLDLKFIRENLELVKKNCDLRSSKVDPAEVVALEDRRLEILKQVESLRTERNQINEEIKKAGKPTPEQIASGRQMREKLDVLETELKEAEKAVNEKAAWIPNILSSDTPIGKDEKDNVEVKAWTPKDSYLKPEQLGKYNFSEKFMPRHAFGGKHHADIGESLGLIDTKQSALVSGSRFYYLKNEAVLLQMAVFDLLKNKLIKDGFMPMVVPLLVGERSLYGTSHFPGDADQVYKIENKYVEEGRDLYLVGSSEPSLFSYFMDKTLKEAELPQKMFATTTCFRSEVGSWGKDVRGVKRVHQFDKLEMDVVCTPAQSTEIHEQLLAINEWLLQSLKIPYHVILMCSGDAGYFATHKKYDFEAWIPSQGEFMELGSDTNAADFQARRFNTRYVDATGERHYVNNVNDTGIAFPRALIAILDNYQNADGSVTIPEVLRPYLGKDVITSK